ncbi:alpha/beta fold hydrolase [Maribacter algicola]|uniref:Alpha/beta fold hydrolase n=1 Tax=Meishania litoralis TaxID=3434685 RepID=A0ACC7LGA4_9FLAO
MKKLIEKYIPLVYGHYYNLLSLVVPQKTAEKAFHLFCTVRKGKVLPHQKDYLNNCKHELLDVEGYQIQTYNWPGNKGTVLLIHGWESNSFRWRNLIAELEKDNFNILAFDAPGHGYSSGKHLHVPLYSEILQNLIERYRPGYLVAHSVGGMTVLYNEHINKSKDVSKIVTVASPSEFFEIMEHFQNILRFNDRTMRALDQYVFNRFGFYIREFSTSEFVKGNTKKGLLLHDKLDKVTPYHASVKVQANWKKSKLISTEGLGHSLHQDEINYQIIDFLKS